MHALVTGANGHLGFNLVQALRARGHQVRASVRSLADAAKTAPLRALGPVELVEAALDQPLHLRAAVDGVDTLFHVAAVYSTCEPGREQEILDAAIRGTANMLHAAADARVRKVVLTSSVVAVPLTAPGAPPSTEADWNEDLRVPYIRAKTEGERLAWRLADELALNLATVLPGGISGPGFRRNTPTIDLIEAAMRGEFRLVAPAGNFSFVDVRDVAQAHILAAERDAHGRFIACNDVQPSFRALVETMHRIDPRVKLPLIDLPSFMVPLLPLFDRACHVLLGTPRIATPEVVATGVSGRRWNVSSARAKAVLGWAPAIPFEQSLRETMDTLRARQQAA